VNNFQAWLMLHTPDVLGGGLSLVIAVAAGVVLLIVLALILERQRPSRRVSRSRHPDTIPTWGDLYLDSLAEAHRKHHRAHRGRMGAR
jgi:hypothetical protein